MERAGKGESSAMRVLTAVVGRGKGGLVAVRHRHPYSAGFAGNPKSRFSRPIGETQG